MDVCQYEPVVEERLQYEPAVVRRQAVLCGPGKCEHWPEEEFCLTPKEGPHVVVVEHLLPKKGTGVLPYCFVRVEEK